MESTLDTHLALCATNSKSARKSMDNFSGQVETLVENVKELHGGMNDINAEKENAKGMAKGVKLACAVIFGFITVISLIYNIIHIMGQ